MMTVKGEPHPLRCETCGNTKSDKIGNCEYFRVCLKTKQRIWSYQSNFTSIVGCASHSNAGSEAVLDEFLKWLPEYLKENMMCGAKRTRMEIEEKIRELRSQKKGREQ